MINDFKLILFATLVAASITAWITSNVADAIWLGVMAELIKPRELG
ncbi:exported hypothetical protein [Candidatus Desulfosporosinus infrequens]|uniref:Uncharacterized protein n=1 Tax=Candidatus Desulfosporosinus infrequens TaxID=2043169 RepID=A0A2U3LH37_9FIRM|nr:exported hypothetical protein [Candidatus Desulfosporosinus infrequens]